MSGQALERSETKVWCFLGADLLAECNSNQTASQCSSRS